jgi:hypothetical protein
MNNDILSAIGSSLDVVANQRAAKKLVEIRMAIYVRVRGKEFRSRYEKKAYNSLISYLNQDIARLVKNEN